MSIGAVTLSSVESSDISSETGVLVNGTVAAASASVSATGAGPESLVTLFSSCKAAVAIGISSGGCSMAADASTSNSGALTAAMTKPHF